MNEIPASLLDIGAGKMLTGSGRIFDLYNPTMDMIDIEDIGNALGNQCRWNGNIPEFYSVAQHSCVVSWLVPSHLSFAALMHDAAEAYTGDIIRPIKKMLAQVFYDIESRIELAICNKYGIAPELIQAVKKFDDQALDIEYEAFFKNNQLAQKELRHLSSIRLAYTPSHYCWDAQSAKYNFLYNFHNLTKEMPAKKASRQASIG